MNRHPFLLLLIAGLAVYSAAHVQFANPATVFESGTTSVENASFRYDATLGQPVTVGLLSKRAYRALGAQRNSTFCDFGTGDYGPYSAYCENNGTKAYLGDIFNGAYGEGLGGNFGYLGSSIAGGVFGQSNNGHYGLLGDNDDGAWGQHSNSNTGYLGTSDEGVFGQHFTGDHGSLGGSFYGARGWNANNNRGYLGHDDYGVWGTGSPWAGYFVGNVHVTGTFSKGGGSFKIDHPLDPANRYLAHSFVESPDMMNVYNGNVTTDARGEAVVALPDYFEVLNRDFRYQLTAIGGFAPLYIAEEIQGNHFRIAGGAPGMKVSWQVTGIRHDPWAEANRIVVEEDKPTDERGTYLYPRLYGQPTERSVGWVRDLEGMRALKEMPARLVAQRRRVEQVQQRREEARERMQELRRQ